jgi:NADPH2:quinone reductase
MKAAVYYANGGPEVLQYEDVPDAAVTPNGILLEVKAIGIQGGDVLNRARGPLMSTPHIVGYQAAGIIWPIPDDMPFEVAAGIPIEFGTADDCLFEFGKLKAGETVLIQAAAGGVGISAVQLAKAAGAIVLGTASSDERLERLREYGLDVPINYATANVPEAVMAATDGKGADLVVDSVGGSTLEGSVASLAYRGRVSWVGSAGRETENPNLSGLMGKNASLSGVYLGAELAVNRERAWAMIASLIPRVASGELKAVIDSTFPLSEAAAAHRHIESRKAFGRVVLIP